MIKRRIPLDIYWLSACIHPPCEIMPTHITSMKTNKLARNAATMS